MIRFELKVGDYVEVPFGKKKLVLFGMNLKKKIKKILKLKRL